MAFKKELRIKIHNKYNKHCAYCGEEIALKEMQIDHIIPKFTFGYGDKSKIPNYGVDDVQNLNPSCRGCNFYKSTFTIEDFRNQLRTLHERLFKIFIVRMALRFGIINYKKFDDKFYFER